MANFNPQNADHNEHFLFRMSLLSETLDDLPLTQVQRIMLNHHILDLRGLFLDVWDQLPETSRKLIQRINNEKNATPWHGVKKKRA